MGCWSSQPCTDSRRCSSGSLSCLVTPSRSTRNNRDCLEFEGPTGSNCQLLGWAWCGAVVDGPGFLAPLGSPREFPIVSACAPRDQAMLPPL
ncbi:uncharacterized protein DMAD_08021 [Drosophila madeirensis]|uniref:Uncharacterized protein n=1 Tax=Drosophila madeirensis TaxID=30013 RepID=A0AAU9F4P7_DROMD